MEGYVYPRRGTPKYIQCFLLLCKQKVFFGRYGCYLQSSDIKRKSTSKLFLLHISPAIIFRGCFSRSVPYLVRISNRLISLQYSAYKHLYLLAYLTLPRLIASQADIADICRLYSLLCKQRCCRERPAIGEPVLADMEQSQDGPAILWGSCIGYVHEDTQGRRPHSPADKTTVDAGGRYTVNVGAWSTCTPRSCSYADANSPHLS